VLRVSENPERQRPAGQQIPGYSPLTDEEEDAPMEQPRVKKEQQEEDMQVEQPEQQRGKPALLQAAQEHRQMMQPAQVLKKEQVEDRREEPKPPRNEEVDEIIMRCRRGEFDGKTIFQKLMPIVKHLKGDQEREVAAFL